MTPQVPLWEETEDKHKNFRGARSSQLESQKGLRHDPVPKSLIVDVQTGEPRIPVGGTQMDRWRWYEAMKMQHKVRLDGTKHQDKTLVMQPFQRW